MNQLPLYPLCFEPIFQYRLWGGRRLADVLSKPLQGEDPIGEAWVLSDRDDFSSVITNGPLANRTLTQVVADFPEQILGSLSKTYKRFPLLLKFLDATELLSVQVHPSDWQIDLLPEGEHGKSEAWVVIEAEHTARIYAGLKIGTTEASLRKAIGDGTLADFLPSFSPRPGDAIFIPSRTVHTLGGGVVVFEVQENSDVTFRLSDWNRIDSKTGKPRELSVDKAIAAIDFREGERLPVNPLLISDEPVIRERLFECDHFWVYRMHGSHPFSVGEQGEPRVLVCLAGTGHFEFAGTHYCLEKGDVCLLPAYVGACLCVPENLMTVLEISIPDFS